MADLPIPDGMGVPLVDLATHRLPEPTETATVAVSVAETRATLSDVALSGAYGDLTGAPTTLTPGGGAVVARDQNSDGSYPPVGDLPDDVKLMYIGTTFPDPVDVPELSLFVLVD